MSAILLSPAPSPPLADLKELTNALIYGETLDGLPPTEFHWAPGGDRFVFMRRPDRDTEPQLQVYDVATRRITSLTSKDDGPRKLSVSSAQWSPAGDALLVVSGGDLYLLSAPRQGALPEPRRLTKTDGEEKDPKLSPDGRMVGFVRDHDLHVMDLATGSERAVTAGGSEDLANGEVDWVYQEELEISSVWWWSPDSKSLAYLQFDDRAVPTYPIVDWIPTHPETRSQHYPKAGDANPIVRLGVVPSNGGETRWMDLGAEKDIYIPRVAWTNVAGLAVQRLDRAQVHLELLLCDPGAGSCHKVLEENDRKWINIADDWRLLDRTFIWGSERDGYRHLYVYDYDGRMIRRLTQGSWTVSRLADVDERGGWIYFTATEKDPMERHLYRVRMDGSGFDRVTREEGWHDVAVSGVAAAFIDAHSTAMNAATTTLRKMDGAVIDTLDEGVSKMLAGYRRGHVEFRSAPAPDGASLPAVMTLPPDFDPAKRYPVLIYVYGGPHAQIVKNQWGGPRWLWHQMMAARGFIVWSLDNRGMAARGHAWETPIYHDMGRRELADQLAGVAYLTKLPYVDASRIGIWGWSYGGYMTLYSLLNAPDVFRAGVAVAPVTDWHDYDTIYTERYLGRPVDNEKGYVDSAPLKKAGELRAPLLLVHGSSDDNVHLQNSVQILDAFVKAQRPLDFMLYPRKNHGIPGKEARTHLFDKITRFLIDNLMNAGTPP